jgi:hypothetical protein
MNRPMTYTVAAILQLLISLMAVVYAVPLVFQGAAAVDQAGDQPPFFILVMAFSLGLLGLVSAYGVWRNQKWGVILTIVLRAVDALSALPGVVGAPTTQLQIFASGGVAISVVIIVLLLWPTKSRLATPASTEPS